VYYPDHLVRMPGPGQDLYSMAWGLLTEPVFKGLFSGAIFEYNRPSRPINLDDESVGSFLERRLGSPDPGNNIVSAVLHGIYAGDIYQLSARSLMPKFWYYEGFRGSISNSMYSAMRERSHWIPLRDAALQNEMIQKVDKNVLNLMGGASVYTFKEGIGALSESLERSLRANPNVEFKMNEEVSRIEYDGENDGVKVKFQSTSYSLFLLKYE
jgi:protoporphyrinogen/coproporphyrinogen III oxidase